MTEKLSPRIAAALADLQSAIDAEAAPGVMPNVMVVVQFRPGNVHAYYSGCACMQCTMTNIRAASRRMNDHRAAADTLAQSSAVAAAGQVH